MIPKWEKKMPDGNYSDVRDARRMMECDMGQGLDMKWSKY